MSGAVSLGTLARITSGGTPDRTNPGYWNGSVPWVKTALIQNCEIEIDDIDERITEAGLAKSSAKLIPAGSILMAMVGQGKTRGQVAILRTEAAVSQNCAAIILKEGADCGYVYQQLLFRYKAIRNASNSSGQQNLNAQLICEIRVPLPPLLIQRLVAGMLFTWDRAIEKAEQLVVAKKRLYGAHSDRLLFGIGCLGQRKGPTTKKLHWFRVSSAWGVTEIGRVAAQVSVKASNDSTLPVLSCTKHDGLVDSLTYFNKRVFGRDMSNYKLVQRGQFAYATNHIEEGSIGYLDFAPAGLVSPIYTVFQADASRVDDGYLYKLLKTEKLRQLFAARTNASVNRRGSLRWKEFARIRIPLPPLDEQRQINAFLDELKREIALLQTEAEAMRRQKRGLMQKLLTGEWRLPLPPAAQAKETS